MRNIYRIGVLIGLLILLIFVSGCTENSEQTYVRQTPIKTETSKTAIATKDISRPAPTPTPVPTPTKKVSIIFNSRQYDKLYGYGDYHYPKPGMTFLVINTKITNEGYSAIEVSSYQWSMSVSTHDNPGAFVRVNSVIYGKEDGVDCPETVLHNGGWMTCKVPFEVPENHKEFTVRWSGETTNSKVDWKFDPNADI